MDAAPSNDSVIVPAATVVLARDTDDGIEVLMLRRNARGPFGGMWVFPGGQIDAEDADPDRPDDELSAAARAAVREAREEAGLELDTDALVPFSHWMPPALTPRRFATWFFLAPAPSAVDVLVDGTEIHDHGWVHPEDALRRRDAGEIDLAPPTWVTLWRLAAAGNVEAAIADARLRDPERFETRMRMVDDQMVAVWHGDAAYEEGADFDGPGSRHRLWMLSDGWRYERAD